MIVLIPVLSIAFMVRYNALIYPLISLIAILLTRNSVKRKINYIVIMFFPIGLFVLFTMYQYKQETEIWQFSPFSGWQLANNAMYAYKFVDSASRKPVLPKFRNLDNMIRRHFDTTRDAKKHPEELSLASTMYMWTRHQPLFKYRDSIFRSDTISSEFRKWASMGPFYAEYGKHIIRKYPMYYFKYFIVPNSIRYYSLPLEYLSYYNEGKDYVQNSAKEWFNYKSNKVFARTKTVESNLIIYYPVYTGIMNALFLFLFISF
ncbi:hypothetical protein [Paraflavitalea speifideaquila]|uniref:hypothetical protein n=1 Tax=Paraflavitalea speifideaquila TaxID=3076558 RepID=UPI0028E5E987|nr:hypothetical protein [Paraflavitalea speifideiaquila]